MRRPYDQVCPITRTLDLVGDRWTIVIIRDLLKGMTRFNQFLESSPGLSTKLLSDRLRRLTERGLVERSIYSQHPLRAEYGLTEVGASLRPVIQAIARWGLEHCFEDEPEERAEIAANIFGPASPVPNDAP